MSDKVKEFEDALCKALLEDNNEFVNACQEYSYKEIMSLFSEKLLPKLIRVFIIFCKKYKLVESEKDIQTMHGPMMAFMNVTLTSVIKSAIDTCTNNTIIEVAEADKTDPNANPVIFTKVDRVIH
jgi:hypothetical protein